MIFLEQNPLYGPKSMQMPQLSRTLGSILVLDREAGLLS